MRPWIHPGPFWLNSASVPGLVAWSAQIQPFYKTIAHRENELFAKGSVGISFMFFPPSDMTFYIQVPITIV